MGVLNTAPITDVRKVMSGKDGGLFDGDGNLLVSVENFQSQVSINNGTFQPLGDAQEEERYRSPICPDDGKHREADIPRHLE